MKALIATDGSAAAIAAAKHAQTILRDGELIVVTVVARPEPVGSYAGGFAGPLLTQSEVTAIHEANDAAGEAAAAHTAEVLDSVIEVEVVHGDEPGRTICELAKDHDVDVIVTGASDKNLLERFMSGSVMRYLIKHSHVPVLIVNGEDD